MTKVYTFYDDSWYDQPGCSCCGGFLMEAYNSSDTSCNLGTARQKKLMNHGFQLKGV